MEALTSTAIGQSMPMGSGTWTVNSGLVSVTIVPTSLHVIYVALKDC
jgi:hypothetical protein